MKRRRPRWRLWACMGHRNPWQGFLRYPCCWGQEGSKTVFIVVLLWIGVWLAIPSVVICVLVYCTLAVRQVVLFVMDVNWDSELLEVEMLFSFLFFFFSFLLNPCNSRFLTWCSCVWRGASCILLGRTDFLSFWLPWGCRC